MSTLDRDRSPLVCVVIPSRDRDSVRTAIDSVLDQEVNDLEVVIVDDGSQVPVADRLSSRDPRVRVVRNASPQGPAVARNLGASQSRSEFVGFLDDDDTWLPGKLRACLQCFARYPDAGMVEHRAAVWSHAPVPPETPPADTNACLIRDPVRRMLTKQPPHVDAVLVRRAVHEAVLFDEGFRASADLDYMLRAAMEAPVVSLDQILAVHGPVESAPSSISARSRVDGRRAFRAKHAHLFRDREIVAFYNLRLGHQHRRAGMRRQAFVCFVRSMSHRRVAWRGLKGMFMTTFLPSTHAGGR